MDAENQVLSLVGKPMKLKSNYAVIGLYFYDERACDFIIDLEPSDRDKLEVTDLNRRYLDAGDLTVGRMARGYVRLDTRPHASLHQASELHREVGIAQGPAPGGCPEEIVFRQGWNSREELLSSEPLNKSGYGDYPGHGGGYRGAAVRVVETTQSAVLSVEQKIKARDRITINLKNAELTG